MLLHYQEFDSIFDKIVGVISFIIESDYIGDSQFFKDWDVIIGSECSILS